MTLPLGFPSPKPNKVCKLVKSLYRLKQASCQWFAKFSQVLIKYCYKQAFSDHTFFLKHDSSTFTTLFVYDDIIVAGNSLAEFDSIKKVLDAKFKIKDLGLLKLPTLPKGFHYAKGNIVLTYSKILVWEPLSLHLLLLVVPFIFIKMRANHSWMYQAISNLLEGCYISLSHTRTLLLAPNNLVNLWPIPRSNTTRLPCGLLGTSKAHLAEV